MKRIRTATLAIAIFAFFAALVGANSARAALITHEFSGEITFAREEEPYTALQNQPFTGTLTYETNTPPVDGLTGQQDYHHIPEYHAAVGLDIIIGETQFLHDDEQLFTVVVSVWPDHALSADTGLLVDGEPLVCVLFSDSTRTAFSDTSLPTTLPLDAFTSKYFQVILPRIGPSKPPRIVLTGEILSLTTHVIPEPSTALLLAFGLVGLAVRRRLRRNCAR